jgi:spore maturation protein CgeB
MPINNSLNNLILKYKSSLQTRKLVNELDTENVGKYFIPKEEQIARIQNHLRQKKKSIGLLTKPVVMAAVHNVNWERAGLVDPWKELAKVMHYDWGGEFDQNSRTWQDDGKKKFNASLLEVVTRSNKDEKIDIFFSYLSGRWVYPETIEKIGALGIITINISFDDKIQFWGYRESSGLSGNAEIAKRFDVCVTCQSKEDVGKYVFSDANPIFLPPGGNPVAFSYLNVERTNIISFIGQCYGVRPKFVKHLRKNGIEVLTYGLGWPNGQVPQARMNEIYNQSLINLGFGYIGNSGSIRGLKGRDFEIPLAGNLYLTTYHPSLEDAFKIGTEIDCYQDANDLVEKVKFYIDNPEKAMKIGEMGRKRCLKDHTWSKRYSELLSVISGDGMNASQSNADSQS